MLHEFARVCNTYGLWHTEPAQTPTAALWITRAAFVGSDVAPCAVVAVAILRANDKALIVGGAGSAPPVRSRRVALIDRRAPSKLVGILCAGNPMAADAQESASNSILWHEGATHARKLV